MDFHLKESQHFLTNKVNTTKFYFISVIREIIYITHLLQQRCPKAGCTYAHKWTPRCMRSFCPVMLPPLNPPKWDLSPLVTSFWSKKRLLLFSSWSFLRGAEDRFFLSTTVISISDLSKSWQPEKSQATQPTVSFKFLQVTDAQSTREKSVTLLKRSGLWCYPRNILEYSDHR